MKPFVQLTGTDGNVFAIIGRVSGTLKSNNLKDQADEFIEKAFASGRYEEVIQLVSNYCEVG
ncbi:hypothetical protein IAQ67_29080 (plasmid) [Paenibacillus peoriae]|uniref:Uncharacterized protein n=1 Tax=Paenibacillus peoriae TaxID=59893 RepID=A0A7H0YH51_9BACL|nr:hypothetical protein [Paenibacillus peoriae]QNR70409.1 hypothetical protein IAQ67_29080 [Paenibacillus peoriae]